MKLGYTILYVPDVRASLRFYEQAFGLATKFLHEGGDFGELDTGGTSLAFCSLNLLQQMGKTPGRADVTRPVSEVALVTADVPAAFARAATAGATPLQAPEDMPWGQTVAYVADPDGFWVELCTPVG